MGTKLSSDQINSFASKIKNNSVFNNLRIENIRNIIIKSEYFQLNKDYILIKEGEYCNDIFIILEGEIEISINSEYPDKKVVVTTKVPFEMIGEIGLLSNEKRTATAMVTKPTEILRFKQEVFLTLLSTVDGLSLSFIKELSRKVLTLINHINTISQQNKPG